MRVFVCSCVWACTLQILYYIEEGLCVLIFCKIRISIKCVKVSKRKIILSYRLTNSQSSFKIEKKWRSNHRNRKKKSLTLFSKFTKSADCNFYNGNLSFIEEGTFHVVWYLSLQECRRTYFSYHYRKNHHYLFPMNKYLLYSDFFQVLNIVGVGNRTTAVY